MIEPVRSLMYEMLRMDVVTTEFSAGYGIADIVGASLSYESCKQREKQGLAVPLDWRTIQILSLLRPGVRTSLRRITTRVGLSESTLKRQILPKMYTTGLIERDADGYVRLISELNPPAQKIVAVEAKQTRWRDAIIQARRYTFFANQTYIAVWTGTAAMVDRRFLYKHRLGLIAVHGDTAEVLVGAPVRKPRNPDMYWLCAETIYGHVLNDGAYCSDKTSNVEAKMTTPCVPFLSNL